MSGELMQIPSVILTKRAFDNAREAGIINIEPNRDLMLAIGQLTQTGNEHIPEITIMREHTLLKWDVKYENAEPDYQYYPSRELGVTERGLQTVSAGGLRDHSNKTGKKILQLTVRDWDNLGATYAEAIHNIEGHSGKNAVDLIGTPLAKADRFLLRRPTIQTQRMRDMENAKNLQPYTIRHR